MLAWIGQYDLAHRVLIGSVCTGRYGTILGPCVDHLEPNRVLHGGNFDDPICSKESCRILGEVLAYTSSFGSRSSCARMFGNLLPNRFSK